MQKEKEKYSNQNTKPKTLKKKKKLSAPGNQFVFHKSLQLAFKNHLSWRSWSSPHGLLLPLRNSSLQLLRVAFIWSMPTTFGCNNFVMSPRKELYSGSGMGGISSDVVMQLCSRSTTTTYDIKMWKRSELKNFKFLEVDEISKPN